MTKRLYYDSAYTNEWETAIVRSLTREDGFYVVLEETAFYPHGGGQPCDTGTIGGIPVLDVTGEGDEVLHKVASLPGGTGAVRCRLDWDRRFDHMQQHSGQHLLSAVCLRLFEAATVGFHLGADTCAIDVDKPELSPERLDRIEREANRLICGNLPVTSYWVTEEEASRLPLVKPAQARDRVRIVEIEGVEVNACGGTHVSSTGSLGLIKLLKAEKQKGNTRIYFKCGYRALAEFNECQRILNILGSRFHTGKEELPDRIAGWELEAKRLQAELSRLKEENEGYLARALLQEREDGRIVHVFGSKPLKELQSLASRLAEEGACPVLLAESGEHKIVLAGPGAGTGLSCGAFNGKGGGSDKLAQAGFASWEDASAFLAFAKETLAGAAGSSS